MENTSAPEIPPSVPLELFLINLKLYRDFFSFYKSKGIYTLEEALSFRDFPTKKTAVEEKKIKFLLDNIRAIRETLPKNQNEQIIYLINKEIIFEEEKTITTETLLNSYKTSTTKPNFCRPNKFQSQNLKPSTLFSANVENKKITNISIKDSFSNLKHLYLNDNFIQKIGFFNCPNLELLDLTNNFIKKMENLEQFPKLNKLSLSNNLIYILENLQNNPDLEIIDLGNQYIPNFVNFAVHPQCASPNNLLSSINLEGCNLISCSELGQFPLLRDINLKNNGILDLMNVLTLTKRCPYIEKINVLNNPFTQKNKTTYKNFIIISCKNLNEINEKEVKENEKIYVNNLFARKYNHNPNPKKPTNKNNVSNGLTITHVTRNNTNNSNINYANLYNYK